MDPEAVRAAVERFRGVRNEVSELNLPNPPRFIVRRFVDPLGEDNGWAFTDILQFYGNTLVGKLSGEHGAVEVYLDYRKIDSIEIQTYE